jgi:hypothetical protein
MVLAMMISFHIEEVAAPGDADAASSRRGALEEAELLGTVADQHVLGLLIMIQHHPVVLTADA